MKTAAPRIVSLVAPLAFVLACAAEPAASADAGVASDASPSADATSTSDQEHCVAVINQYRATLGLPPYARYSAQETCVDGEAAKDAAAKKAHSTFGSCSESAQNECPGWPGSNATVLDGCLLSMWKEGPGADFQAHGHYINMASTTYTKAACGFHRLPDGSVWAIQNFY